MEQTFFPKKMIADATRYLPTATRYLPTATRYLPTATCQPLPANRHPLPANRHRQPPLLHCKKKTPRLTGPGAFDKRDVKCVTYSTICAPGYFSSHIWRACCVRTMIVVR